MYGISLLDMLGMVLCVNKKADHVRDCWTNFQKTKTDSPKTKRREEKPKSMDWTCKALKKKTRFQPQNVRFELQKWTTILAGKNNDF